MAGVTGLAAAVGTALAVAPASPASASQAGWRWCRLCQGLWYAGNPTAGVCPSNGDGWCLPGKRCRWAQHVGQR